MNTTNHINWNAVYQQLEAGRQGLKNALNPPANQVAQKRHERAQKLRQRHQTNHASATQTPFLVILLGNEHYAIPLGEVLEIQPFHACTPLPGSPPNCMGVVNHRGQLKMVFSLSLMLGQKETETLDSHILFLRAHNLGLIVDRAVEIQKISNDQWSPPATHTIHNVGLGPQNLIRLNLQTLLSPIQESNTYEPDHR